MSNRPPVILLAGGASSRFYPLNSNAHKAFIQLCGKPLIVHALENLLEHGFTQVVVVVTPRDYADHKLGSLTESYGLKNLDLQAVLQPEPKGQGDAIVKAAAELDHPETVLVASPYHIKLGEILTNLWEKHQEKSDSAATLMGMVTENPQDYGILSVEEDQVTAIIEKPDPTSEKPAEQSIRALSCYCLSSALIGELAKNDDHYSLELTLNSFAKQGKVWWNKSPYAIASLKYAWHLLEMAETIISAKTSYRADSAQIAETAVIDESQGPVIIDEYAQVKDFAKITGPAYIGTGVLVGEYCFVRGGSLEHNVVLGSNTELVRSILLPGVSIHQGYCSDSILGENTHVGAGLVTANLRLDRQDVKVTLEEKRVSSQRRKLGLITGPRTNIGVNVTTMPGVLVGEGATIFPSQTLFHSVPAQAKVKNSTT